MLVMFLVGIPLLYLCYSFYPSCCKSDIQGNESGNSFCFPPCGSGNHNYGRPLPWKAFGCTLSGSNFPLCPWGRIPARLVLSETWDQCSCNHGNCKRTTSRRSEAGFCSFPSPFVVIRNIPQGKRMRLSQMSLK